MPKQCIWLKFEISWNMLTYLDEIYDVEICLWNLWMRYNEMLPVFLDVSESDSSCLHLVQWDTNSFLNHSCSKNCTSVFMKYVYEIYDLEICLWILWMRYNEMLPVFLDVSESDSSCLHLVQWDTNSFLNHSCSKNCTSVFMKYVYEIYDVEICLWNLWMRYNEMLPVFLDVSESDSSCLHLVQWDTNSFWITVCSKNCTSVFMKYVYEIYDLEIGLWILWMRYNEMLPVFLDVSESDSSCLHLVQWDTNSFLNHSCSKKIAPLCLWNMLWNLWSWNRFMNFMNEI